MVFAESTDRFVRPSNFHSQTNSNAQPRVRDMSSSVKYSFGGSLATYLHPDATPTEVLSHQSRRGQQAKGKRGGRPNVQAGIQEGRATLKLHQGSPHGCCRDVSPSDRHSPQQTPQPDPTLETNAGTMMPVHTFRWSIVFLMSVRSLKKGQPTCYGLPCRTPKPLHVFVRWVLLVVVGPWEGSLF